MAESKIKTDFRVLIIGGSAGSLDVLMQLLPGLEKELDLAVVIVVHRSVSAENLLADILSHKAKWPVKEAEEKERILSRHIYTAPADYHLLLEKDHSFSLDVSEKINYSRPSIDVTFESAADAYGPAVIALLLSGANSDGVAGMQEVKARGGLCLVQDPETAGVDYMPRRAVEAGVANRILRPDQMAGFINRLLLQ
jgi:two-component system chemotaxis response regulator CheB